MVLCAVTEILRTVDMVPCYSLGHHGRCFLTRVIFRLVGIELINNYRKICMYLP